METLMDLTGQESGVVVYEDTEGLICNWAAINGFPRLDPFGFGLLGLGEDIPTEVEGEKIEDIGAKLEGINIIYDRNNDLPGLIGHSGIMYDLGDTVIYVPDGWN